MIGEVIEKAADLAASGEPSVDRALMRYQQASDRLGTRERRVWVSVAFLLSRHAALAAALPGGGLSEPR